MLGISPNKREVGRDL